VHVEGTPDRWRATGATGATVFFDMLDGLAPVRNVLGVGDPDVHHVDGRWTMFLGGFTTRFRVALFVAVLPPGAPLSSQDWALLTDPRHPRRAVPLTPDPPRRAWDRKGMHAPSYVRGRRRDGTEEERIYYAGRSSASTTGPSSHRAAATQSAACDGPSPAGDGTGDWSVPRTLFTTQDGYFDNAVQQVDDHYEMVVARGTNLHGTDDFPPQGLWWLRSERPSGQRADWTPDPVRLLDADHQPLEWFANGGCGPSFHYGDTHADRDTLYVFFTGAHAKINWLTTALGRLAHLRRPPVPAPYHLATGRIAIRGPIT